MNRLLDGCKLVRENFPPLRTQNIVIVEFQVRKFKKYVNLDKICEKVKCGSPMGTCIVNAYCQFSQQARTNKMLGIPCIVSISFWNTFHYYWYFLATSILKTIYLHTYFLKWCPNFDESTLFTKYNSILCVPMLSFGQKSI